jgi:HEAT repeat protein
MHLAAHTDDAVRRLKEHHEPEVREAATRELVKRGLETSAESLAKLAADRRKHKRLARNAEGDFGYTGRARKFWL